MTVADAAVILLNHFAPEERGTTNSSTYPGRTEEVLNAMNGALQEIFGQASPWLRIEERGSVLNAPATIPVTMTAGSTAATIASGDWQAWFAGCTIVIAGSDVENRILNDSSPAALKFAWGGASGATSATVWQDSVTVAADVMEVVEPVRVNRCRIPPIAYGNAAMVRSDDDFGFLRTRTMPGASVAQNAATPLTYAVETWSPSDGLAPATRIRLLPAAAATGTLDYKAKLAPPALGSITSTGLLPLPLQFVQSIFLPVARQRLTACPFFQDTGRGEEIGRAYKAALSLLTSLNPRKNAGTRMRPLY
jgi:hypothetical protein